MQIKKPLRTLHYSSSLLRCCILIIICSIHSINPACSQIPSKTFYFQHLKTDKGLANNDVNSILKDHEGYLWIATSNGLNCFDGVHFKTWKADLGNQSQLQINSIYKTAEDRAGFIWCTTDDGISRYSKETNTFKNYKLTNTATGAADFSTIYQVLYLKTGIIATHSKDAVYIYDQPTDQFKCYSLNGDTSLLRVEQIRMSAFSEDPYNNGIWIGTNVGLRYFDVDKRVFFHYKNHPPNQTIFDDHLISAITVDYNKNLVYHDASEGQLATYNFKSNILQKTPTDKAMGNQAAISFIYVDREKNKWISTYGFHLYFQDHKDGQFYSLKNDLANNYSVAGNSISDAIEDADGTIYLATVNGISYTNLKKNFFSINILPDTIVHERQFYLPMLLNADLQNNIWLAPSYKYVVRFNPETNTYVKFDFFPAAKKYKDIEIRISSMEATSDKLYFGTTDGIYIYNINSYVFSRMTTIPKNEGIAGKYILTMELSREGDLWFTSHHNGIFCYNINSQTFKHYVHNESDPHSFTDNYVYDIHADKYGDIWICSENDGLLKFNRAKNNFDYVVRDKNPELNNPIYSDIAHDSTNNLWLINYMTGLTRYNASTNKVTRMSSGYGLSNLSYSEIISDNSDNLWLVHNQQYSVFNPYTLTSTNFIIDYPLTKYIYANHLCRMNDGRIVSESHNAFIIFRPENQFLKESVSPINISGFTVGGNTTPFVKNNKEINLTHSQNFFSIDFSTFSFLKRPGLTYAYKLDGVDNDWVSCGSRQTAYYTNISGGNYAFHVRVKDESGKWVENSTPVTVNISRVFYATLQFKLFLLSMLFVLIYWYYRLYHSKEVKERTEKAIAYFARSVSGKNKIDEIMWDIAHNVIARTDFRDCVVYLLDEKRMILTQKAAFGDKNPESYDIANPLEIPVGEGIVGSVAQSGVAEIINDTSKDSRYIADDAQRLSEITVPIHFEGRVIGVIDCEHASRNHFNHRHLQLLQTIASISGTKITNALKETEIVENEKRLNELTLQMAQTRQQALRAQMNPHFIFNCLNSINGFILQNNAATASTYLIKFSKLIRLILEHSNEKSISLQSEIDALKLYIEMELLRFEKKFSYAITIDPSVPSDYVFVPPLIYQPFIENSIWHGMLHQKKEGRLDVSLTMQSNFLECIIEDNGVGREMSASLKSKTLTQKKSLGLQLTKERLAIMKEQENRNTSVAVYDLVDTEGSAAGTRVVISIECHIENIDEL